MRSDRDRWEERYASGRCGDDLAPSEFLVAHAKLLSGRILDVAAGSGRNALFLARRGLLVDAIDIAFAGLQLARAAAAAEGLGLQLIQADLDDFPLPVSRYDGVINIRYLQRSLFPSLRRAVKPGGLVMVETFLASQQELGHCSNPLYLLQPGELGKAFSGCEILLYEEGLVDSGGAPAYLARLLARRRLGEQD